MTIDHEGYAVWNCFRCSWTGTTRSRDKAEPSLRRPAPPSRPAKPPVDWRPTWNAANPIEPGSLAAAYLIGRACGLPHFEGDLRWHPAQCHSSGWVGPALVALVTDAATGEPLTIHRTWLARDGSGKAPIDKPKLLWSGAPKAGGIVRLWPDHEITISLAIAEGIETTLSLARAFGLAWAAVDSGNLARFAVLPGIETLTIAVDHDRPNKRTGKRPGIEAANECARRWSEEGREVRLVMPATEGADFNDLACGAAA